MTHVRRSDDWHRRPIKSVRLAAERWRRLRRTFEQRMKLRAADVVVVSYGKSGRTWLAVMISHVYHQKYQLDPRVIIQFDNFHRLNDEIPRILFTHDQRPDLFMDKITPRFQRPLAPVRNYIGKKVIWLVRDPRDVAVSHYFQLTRRDIHKYARSGAVVEPPPLFDYVTEIALPKTLEFMRRWERRIRSIPRSLVIRYEDLREAPTAQLSKVMNFIGGEFTPEIIERAVAFGAFANMRDKEQRGFFTSERMQPGELTDPDSFKVRRGKVCGYRDYFTPDQLARIEAVVANRLPDGLGYRR